MRPFAYIPAPSAASAIAALQPQLEGQAQQGRPPAEYLAGGTTLIDLMKLDVMRPAALVDINRLRRAAGGVAVGPDGVRLDALATMASVADHPDIIASYPVLAQSLTLAASAQLRNMASIGGNVLQRTRCTYFRDPSWAACNKRDPGSGCAALDGVNRMHAVLGTSTDCIATYPGDFAQALLALDATVELVGPDGARTIPFAALHKAPEATPHLETTLRPAELITAFVIKGAPWMRRSLYLKVRDRQSYEFALASAAVALEVDGGVVRQARIALGGVATKPWRADAAERMLAGKTIDAATVASAAAAAFATARPREQNSYKVALGQKTIVRALLQAAALEG